jgi:gliding motility-associated-like protein
LTIQIFQNTIVLEASDTAICVGETVQFFTNAVNFNKYDFYRNGVLVQSGIGRNFTTNQLQNGDIITLRGTDDFCTYYSNPIRIAVYPYPTVSLRPDTTIYAGDTVRLWAAGATNYRWTPTLSLSCSTCPDPYASPTQTTDYIVEATNDKGCMVRDTVRITVETRPNTPFLIPNTITPNSDGWNDTWVIDALIDYPENRVSIINRWGDVVFSAQPYRNDFDGRFGGGELPAGTYYYVLELGGNLKSYRGALVILR